MAVNYRMVADVRNSSFERNSAGTDNPGGALFLYKLNFAKVNSSYFLENSGLQGGAIYADIMGYTV